MTGAGLRALMLRDRARTAVIASLFVMLAINQLGTGIVSAVIPVRLAAEGHSASAAGAVSTVFSACFLIGCLIGPRIVAELGVARTLYAVAVLHACLAVLHWLLPGPLAWSILRGVAGLVTATYFVLVESWVASQTTTETRGLVFGIYMVVMRLAVALGQFIIALFDPASLSALFLLAAVVFLVSPMFRPQGDGAATSPPPSAGASLLSYLDLPRHAPAAAAAAFSHGVLFATVPGLMPKWGIDVGLSVGEVATLLAVVQLGGLFLQLPISYASDRFDRRTIMAFASLSAALVSVAILKLPVDGAWARLFLVLAWGGFTSSLYSLGMAHANDIAPPEQRVAWVSSQMLIWSCGAMAGPVMAAACMDVFGPRALWIYALGASLLLGIFFVWRKVVRPR